MVRVGTSLGDTLHILDPNYKGPRMPKAVSNEALEKIVQKELLKQDPNEMTPLPPPEGWEQTDSLLVLCPGYWWISSRVDKRWKAEGKSEEVGGIGWCPEARAAYWKLKGAYGQQPWDLVYRFEPRDLKKFKLAPRHSNNPR